MTTERDAMLARDALVKQISSALADGKDSGGYATLLDMYAHIALTVIEARTAAQAPGNAQMLEYALRLNDIAVDCDIAAYEGDAFDLRRIAEHLASAQSPGVREQLSDLPRTIDTIENAYAFTCEAGSLANCGEWKYLKRMIRAALSDTSERGEK